MIGFIAGAGVIVRNSIIIVDFIEGAFSDCTCDTQCLSHVQSPAGETVGEPRWRSRTVLSRIKRISTGTVGLSNAIRANDL